MARIFSIQTNFTGGEISPLLRGRVDIAKYANSARTLDNFLITPHGAIRRVSGTSYVNTVQNESKDSVLIPFEASDDTDYLLEFGEDNIRIYFNDGIVLWDRAIPTASSGWTGANTGTATSSVTSGTITLTGTDGSNIAAQYTGIPNPTVNEITLRCDTTGDDVTWKVGTTTGASDVGTGTLVAGIGHSLVFTAATNDSNLFLQFSSEGSSTVTSLQWEPDIEYTIDHPYSQDELSDLKYAQFNDVMYITHKNHKPKRLVRRSVTQWQFHNYDSSTTVQPGDPSLDFLESAYLDYNTGDITITPSAITGSITLTASEELFKDTDVGRYIRWRQGPKSSTGQVTYTGTGAQLYFDVPFIPRTKSDLEVYLVPNTGEKQKLFANQFDVVNDQVHWLGSVPTTAQKVIIQRKDSGTGVYGFARITAFTSAKVVSATVVNELNGTSASTEWALGAWSDTTGYPRAVTFFQQRLWLGGTKTDPQKLWGSQIGNFYDFSGDTADRDGSVDSVSSLALEVASNRISTVEWLAGREQLVVGTGSSAFALTPTGQSGITASNPPLVEKVSEVGCYKSQSITTDSSTLFINRQQNKVYELIYSFEADSLITADLTLLSEHLSEIPFKKIIRMETPDNIMWVLREDGTLVCLTYMPDQKIAGWSRITMSGEDAVVKDIITLRGGYENVLYMIVERTINGSPRRYIEKLQPYFRYSNKKEAWFVQSGLHLDNSKSAILTLGATSGSSVTAVTSVPTFSSGDVGRFIQNNDGAGYAEIISYTDTSTVTLKIFQTFEDTNLDSLTWSLSVTSISGLDHLEGQTIRVLVDGANHPPVTVASGEVTLNTPSFYIIAGLGYTSTVETNYIEGGGQYGSVQGSIARTHEVALRFFETIGGSIGYSSAKVDEITFRNADDPMDEGPNLFTGDKIALLPTDYQIGAKMTYIQSDPLPATIVSLVLKVNMADT
jgi:hypothetical protein